jgi:MerR family transcriptional regulator, copper efflux regulator
VNIRELAKKTGAVDRQIRYMISEGFVPSPRGPRSQPEYGEDHVDAIRAYLALRAVGLPPSVIRIIATREDAVVIPLAEGISLSVSKRRLGKPIEVNAITERIALFLEHLQQEP